MNGMSTADFLWNIQCSVILQLAEKGPCVIVGRNADYILKDRKDVLHAYIHADKPFRADRIVRLYGESEKSPEARLNEKDKRRHVNYQHYTGRVWGTAQNYDICLNSGNIGVEACADIIVNLVNASKEK
jgi:cytidylate kinase